MSQFHFFATPWWVNIFFLTPFVAYYFLRGRLAIARNVLLYTAFFGISFGYVEAAVVVYLRGAIGIAGSPNNIVSAIAYQQADILAKLPYNLFAAEMWREATTLVMILLVSLLAVKKKSERWAVFFWVFAFWDIFYYVWLKVLIGWPQSLLTEDVLFLIPVPWYTQVWWPVLVSLLLISAVIIGNKSLPSRKD